MKLRGRVWFWLAGAAALATAAAACGKAAPRPPRNVLLISIDTLRRDHVGLYGARPTPTPNLDGFFADGTVYERAVSPAPCTHPAIVQVLTGMLEPRAQPRLAEMLESAGYDTHAIVSHHFFRGSRGPNPRFQRGYQSFDVQARDERNQYGMTSRRAETVSDRAIVWLRKRPRNPVTPPFHLWLHYFDPHDPYDPPSDARTELLRGVSGDRRGAQCAGGAGLGCERRDGSAEGEPFSAERSRELRALYTAEVRYTDREIGRVLRTLEELELLEDTWVVLWSDHGEQLGEDGVWDHCQSVHSRELLVPLLVRRGRGRLGADPRHVGAVSTLDIVPTLLSQLGRPADPDRFDGTDLARSSDDRAVVSVWLDQRTAVSGAWKLNVRGDVSELIDLEGDPDERSDASGAHRERAAALARALEATAERDVRIREQSNRIVEDLRAIGYIE
ncbi:MAG: sulfatase [Myxococcota bacterium]